MSAVYDGNIKLGVSVTADSKSVVTELGALRKQIVDMFSSVDKSLAGGSGSFSNLEKSLAKIATDVGDIAKAIKGLPTKDVANVVDAIKEVGTAAQDSGKAVESALDFDVATASTEELYQKLKQLRKEMEVIKEQKLSEGFTPAQAANSKDVRKRQNQADDITNELRNNRGLSDTTDYAPAMSFVGDVGSAQVKNLENSLTQAHIALQSVKDALANMNEDDDGFEEKTARVNELTQAIMNLNEQLAFEQSKLPSVATSNEPSTDGSVPSTTKPESGSKINHYEFVNELMSKNYDVIARQKGEDAAKAFYKGYTDAFASGGLGAAWEYLKANDVEPKFDSGNQIAKYQTELVALQAKMRDFNKLKITMSDEEVGQALNRIEELKAKIAELTKDAQFMTLDTPFDDGLRDNLRAVEELQTKMKQYQQTGNGFGSMEEAQTASANLARLTQSVNEYLRSLDPAQQKLSEFTQALSEMETLENSPGKYFTPEEATQYEAASAKVRQYKNDLASLIQMRNALKSNISLFEKTGTGMNTEQYQRAKALLAELNQQYVELTRSAEEANQSMSGFSIGSALNGTVKSLSNVGHTITKLIKRVGTLIGKFTHLGRVGTKAGNNIGKSFRHSLTNMLKYGLGIRSIFMLFRRLRSTAIDSLKAIASQFPHINAQFSETKTLLSGLKGSFGTLALPLITAVLPAINAVISAITAAIQALARFFTILGGGTSIVKATAKTQDFADSMGGAGGAAKDAVKSLMAFDELNLLQDDAGGGGGGGAEWEYEEEEIDPNSAIAKFAEMVKEAWATGDFTDVGTFLGEHLRDGLLKLDQWITTEGFNLSKKIGNSFATLINGIVEVPGLADAIGRTVADAVDMAMIGLRQFLKTTHWFNVGKFVADAIMNFFACVDWKGLGQTIGYYILALADSLYGFVTNINFEAIGEYIATAINNIFNIMGAADENGMTGWQKLGKSLSDGVTGLLEMLIKAVQEVNWGAVGKAIGEFLGSIDFGQIAWDVTTLITNLVAAIAEGIANWAKTDPISAAITALLGGAMLGVKVIPGIASIIEKLTKFNDKLKLIKTTFSTLGTKVSPVLSKIGSAFSTIAGKVGNVVKLIGGKLGSVLTTIGSKISSAITSVAGFFGKIGQVFSIVKSGAGTVQTAMQTVFGPGSVFAGIGMVIGGAITAISSFFSMLKNGFSWLKEILMVIGIAIAAVGAIILGAPAAVAGVIAAIVAAVMTLVVVVKDNWEAICNWFKETWNAICEWFKSTWETIKTGWNSFWTAVGEFFKNLWNGICQWFKDAWNSTVNWFKTTWTDIQTGWNNFWNKVHQIVQNIWNGIVSFFTTIWTTITNMFKVKMDFISGIITSVFNGIKTTITNVWTAIKDFITATLDNIKNTFSGIWNGIKSVVTSIVGAIKSAITGDINGLKSNISNALNGIKSIFTSVWNGISNSVTNIVNGMRNVITGVIDGIRSAVSGVASTVKNTINTVIRALNGLSFTVPSWVPGGMGGKRFGFNIPYLAQGAVIPPNKEFMAVLGDQKHGTNIEAPLDTIKQAVAEELSDYIDAMMAGFDAVVNAIDAKDMNVSIGDSAIGRAAERYQRRQQLVRGNT